MREAFFGKTMTYSTHLPGEVIVYSLEGYAYRPTTGTPDLRSSCCTYAEIRRETL